MFYQLQSRFQKTLTHAGFRRVQACRWLGVHLSGSSTHHTKKIRPKPRNWCDFAFLSCFPSRSRIWWSRGSQSKIVPQTLWNWLWSPSISCCRIISALPAEARNDLSHHHQHIETISMPSLKTPSSRNWRSDLTEMKILSKPRHLKKLYVTNRN